jgi:phage-related protein
MNANNIILNLPFDESAGSAIAYDYSTSRADGQVIGAQFTHGKNGNAIKFAGNDTCEVSKSVLPNMNAEFSFVMWVMGGEIECGSPRKLIWLLNFSGLNNSVEIPIEAKAGVWFHLAMTRRGSSFNFYVNSSLVKTFTNIGVLLGISLNQDVYVGDYGIGCLDGVKFYNVALTQEDLIAEQAVGKRQAYLIDGIDFKEYGVFVSDSKGVVGRPKLKAPASVSWDNYHGNAVDLNHKFYEPREITLSCFIKADNKNDFISRMSEFAQLFDKSGSQRLMIDVHPIKALVYEVYCKDEINVVKKWSDELMVGTFDLKLIEPEPVKRVLKHMRVNESTRTCTVTLTSTKLVNIYWGDGTVDFDVSGENVTITHDYATNGDFFVIVTGCIDEISAFSTNAIVVWNKL